MAALSLVVVSFLAPWIPASPQRVAFVGDSVAASLAEGLAAEAGRRGIEVEPFTRVGCGITPAVPVESANRAWVEACAAGFEPFFASVPKVDALVLLSSWEVGSQVVDGEVLEYLGPAWRAWMTAWLDRWAAKADVLIVVTVPPRAPIAGIVTMSPEEIAHTRAWSAFLARYAAAHPASVGVVDLDALVCPGGPCPEFVDGIRLRPWLGAHFEGPGADWVAPRFIDELQRAWERVGSVATAPDGLF